MLRYTQISNISCVDLSDGTRTWASFVLIDMPHTGEHARKGPLDDVRQIRGFTNGGLPVFTVWVDPKSTIKYENREGGNIVLLSDAGNINMDAGVFVVMGDKKVFLAKADTRKPFDIREIEVEMCPFGSEVDAAILEHYNAPNYPVVAYVPAAQALDFAKRLRPSF